MFQDYFISHEVGYFKLNARFTFHIHNLKDQDKMYSNCKNVL